MKRLALFVLGAFVFFEASYALSDRQMFFGSDVPAPKSGVSERPAVEAALSRLDEAMVRFYGSGDEGPLRAVLLEPDGEGSPLFDWRVDRHAWLERGEVPSLTLLERRIGEVSVGGLDAVGAVASERWATHLDGGGLPGSSVVVRYQFRRGPAGLLLSSVVVQP